MGKINLLHSTYKRKNPTVEKLKISIFIFLIVMLFIGSQSILSSYPIDILLNNQTKFQASFDSISGNQITINGKQTQLNPGDVISLKTGGFIKIKAHQSQSDTTEALKYGNYKLNQVLLFEQKIYEWNFVNRKIELQPQNILQSIILSYNPTFNTIQVDTPLTSYNIILRDNDFTLITSDNGEMLYKLSRTGNIINIQTVGFYSRLPIIIEK